MTAENGFGMDGSSVMPSNPTETRLEKRVFL